VAVFRLPFRSAIFAGMNASWTTQAAEGLPRRGFTVTEVERMVEVGVLHEDERIELIGGEIVPMSPKGIRHEVLKAALLEHWYRRAPQELRLIPETTLRLSPDTCLEPDILVFPRALPLAELAGDRVLFAVELSDSSLSYDLNRKPDLYASFGVPELWVVDAVRFRTHVHRLPREGRYASIEVMPRDAELVPSLAPGLPVRLSELELS
jgi:Uma2 family endonuclease